MSILRVQLIGCVLVSLVACAQATPQTKPVVATAATQPDPDLPIVFERHLTRGLHAAQKAFVQGIAFSERGQWAEAKAQWQRIAKSKHVPQDYVAYYLGTAAEKLGEVQVAREAYARVGRSHPHSRFFVASQLGEARMALAQRLFPRVRELIARAQELPDSPREIQRSWTMMQADLARVEGRNSDAAAHYRQLYQSAEFASELEVLAPHLASLPPQLHPLAGLTPTQRIALAGQFTDRGMASEAVRILQPVATHNRIVREQLAMAHFRAREYAQAQALFADFAHSGSVTMNRLLVLQRYATAAARAQEPLLAMATQAQIIQEFPNTKPAASAHYKRAWLMQDSGKCREARQAFASWRSLALRANHLDTAAQWHSGWCAYREGQWQEAHDILREIADNTALSGKRAGWRTRALYWMGRALQRAGKGEQARSVWMRLSQITPVDYHVRLATMQLSKSGLAGAFAPGTISNPGKHVALEEGVEHERSMQLLKMGLWDHAISDFDYSQGAELEFGARHHAAIEQIASRWQLEPELMRALIRQESYFQPAVRSSAGAIGLMQLMPKTAQRMANALQISNFHESQLQDPLTNMRLGMWYFQGLLQRYNSVVPHALAAYNAGEAAVDRWKAQYPDLAMDEFIESIPFTETRKYVQRILHFYWKATR